MIDGKIAAFMSGIVFDNGKRALFPRLAINDAFARYSPGCLLINEAAKELSDKMQIENLDLSKGTEQYKMAMGGDIYSSYSITIKYNL